MRCDGRRGAGPRGAWGRRASSSAAVAFALLAPRAASAYDALAAPCAQDPLTCERAAVSFDRTDALPIEFNFDTGWVPPSSPLSVHLWAAVYANTKVSLTGALSASWPDALTLEAPGDPGGGAFSYHYGVDIGAQGMVNIRVLGRDYTWTGDIPYVPQFDFQLQSESQFDAWGWDPGVTMTSSTEPRRLATVSLGDLIGASIPGIDGGFELDVALDVSARYQTRRIVVTTTDGAAVSGGPITADVATSSTAYAGGPSVELDVHPEGAVSYDGTLHLIPAFYVSLLGQHWAIPVADIPMGFPITETEWVFDPQRVHVPLPDLVLKAREIDFGEVIVGEANLETVPLYNAGEAQLGVTMASDAPEIFEVMSAALDVDPAVTGDSAIRFVPREAGEFKATILVASNDPDAPMQNIVVRGIGVDAPAANGGGAAAGPDVDQDGSCACRAAGAPRGAPPPAWAAGATILAALAYRRRSRRDAALSS